MRQALLVLAAGAAFGCARNQPQQVAAGTEFELPLGGAAQVVDGPTVTFAQVAEDSRCPIDAVCIQAGRATVRLQIHRGDSASELLLSTRDGASADTVGGHEVRLVALLPPPRAATPTPVDSYRVTLLIESAR